MSQPLDALSSGLDELRRINERCNRFESACQAGTRPRIEDYLGDDGQEGSLVRHLVMLDVDYRRQRGESPCVDDYLGRFADLDRGWLAQQLAESSLGAASQRTSLAEPAAEVSTIEFLGRLEAQGLLTPQEVFALRQRQSPLLQESARAMADHLVNQGKIAEFQARALLPNSPVPLVLGPYTLDGWIAAGGMGQVFRATHRQMKRRVAIKVLQGGAAASLEQRRRFQREVELAARLRHPHIVTAFDAGEEEGLLYLVTEYIDGDDLGRLVHRNGPLPMDRALDYVRQAALGLGHAHACQVIHRDVKPSNLILGQDGIVRVLDVGLARLVPTEGGSHTGLTGVGGLMGTVDYMAPEQAEDARHVDARSDVYSLGCTLYFLLTGRPPFEGPTPHARLMGHRRGAIPSIRALRPDLPQTLDQQVQQMLAKKPEQRPPDMAAVLAGLEACLAPRRISRRILLVGVASAAIAGVAGYLGIRAWSRPPLLRIPFDARAEQARWAAALGVPIELESAAGVRLVLIPPGVFLMGTPDEVLRAGLSRAENPLRAFLLKSERQRERTLTRPYYLSSTEVTVGQYRRFVQATGHVTQAEKATDDPAGGWGWESRGGWRRKRGWSWQNTGEFVLTAVHPVPNLAWEDARLFCAWLSRETGAICRLPTEIEWEFACRAGSAGLWCFGDDVSLLSAHAWTSSQSDGWPHPVAGKRANALGLFDMHGNLAEWCAAEENSTGERPTVELVGPGAEEYQPVRGGNFLADGDQSRAAARSWEHSTMLGPGFRVVQEFH